MNENDLQNRGEERPTPIPLTLPKKRVVWPWFVLLILIIVALGGYIAYKEVYLPMQAKNNDSSAQTKTDDNAGEVDTKTDKVDAMTDSGVTWVTPQKLSDLGLFTKNAAFEGMGEYSATDYYKSGTTASGGEIILAFPQTSPASNVVYRFIKRDAKYYLLAKNSSSLPTADDAYNIGKFESDSSYVLQSLLPDATISKGNTVLVYQFTGNVAAESGFTSGDSLWQSKWGDLYLEDGKTVDGSSDQVVISRYYIKLNDGSRAYYSSKPVFLKDDNSMDVTWSLAAASAYSFEKLPTSGCGSGFGSFPKVTSSADISAKVSAAKYNAKDAIYNFSDTNAVLNKFGYGLYTTDGTSGKKNITDYVADLGLVIWSDDFGSTVVYANSKYAPAVECGKPVIYLYPQQDTQVSVQVAADVTKSEPEYGAGWKVLAKSDGTIQTASTNYPYLFWEGTGKGQYPNISGGVVVKHDLAPSIIKLQLGAMGLSGREIADFCDFWLPKLPSSPYIRLSWFTTQEMNNLAPIKITPAPDSILRVFLDFQGLDLPVAIAPQVLPHFDRQGFAVVEWGGLLQTVR